MEWQVGSDWQVLRSDSAGLEEHVADILAFGCWQDAVMTLAHSHSRRWFAKMIFLDWKNYLKQHFCRTPYSSERTFHQQIMYWIAICFGV